MKTLQKKKFTFNDYWDRYSTIPILALMIAIFGALRPSSFLPGSNLVKIIEQSSITILLGLGEFFAILLGGIDLSVSSTMALSGALTAQLMVNGGLHPLLAIFLGVLVFGAAIGIAALFCGVTNCPIATILLSVELFGGESALFCMIAALVSFLFSGYFSLYSGQQLIYSKLSEKEINVHGH